MTASGSLIGPDWQLKVPGGQSSPWRPPAPPPGQTAKCPYSPGESGAEVDGDKQGHRFRRRNERTGEFLQHVVLV